MSECRLLFGSLDLTAGGTGGYKFSVLAEGADFGSPVPVETAIRTLLQDGSIVSTTSHDNRTTSFQVTITALDGGSLAKGEHDLALQVGKRNTLIWYPPGGFVQPTLFDVVTSSLDYVFDDLGELTHERTYKLTCECLPFGKSLTKVTTSVGGFGTPSILDSCDTVTGWSAPTGSYALDITADTVTKKSGTASVKAGNSQLSSFVIGGSTFYVATNNDTKSYGGSPLSSGAGGYLSVWVRMDSPTLSLYAMDAPGLRSVSMTLVGGSSVTATPAAVEQATGDWVRYAWPVAAGLSIASVSFNVQQYFYSYTVPSRAYVRYDEISLSPSGTSKKVVGSVDVQGSARTPGSLVLTAAGALGEAMIVTWDESTQPLGFAPDCRRFHPGTGTTADTNAVNGSYLTTTSIDVPLKSFADGIYQVVARCDHTLANPLLTVTAQTVIGGTLVGPVNTITGTPTVAAGTTGAYNFLPVGFIDLPAQRVEVPDDTASVRITFTGNGVGRVDDLYLIPADAAVSIVDCGTGTVSASAASSYLWIDAPSIDQIGGGWWRGATSTRVNARSAIPDARALGRHLQTPPRMRMFAVAPQTGLNLSIEYLPQWFTHAWGG